MGKQHVRLLALVASTGELTAQLLLDSSPFLSQEAGCPQLLTFQSVTLVGAGAPLVPGLVSVQQASSIAVECGRFVHRVCVLSLRKNGLVGSSVFLGPASLTHPLPTQTHSLWTNGPSRSFRQACPHAPLAWLLVGVGMLVSLYRCVCVHLNCHPAGNGEVAVNDPVAAVGRTSVWAVAVSHLRTSLFGVLRFPGFFRQQHPPFTLTADLGTVHLSFYKCDFLASLLLSQMSGTEWKYTPFMNCWVWDTEGLFCFVLFAFAFKQFHFQICKSLQDLKDFKAHLELF